jgi:hypothetical protein
MTEILLGSRMPIFVVMALGYHLYESRIPDRHRRPRRVANVRRRPNADETGSVKVFEISICKVPARWQRG